MDKLVTTPKGRGLILPTFNSDSSEKTMKKLIVLFIALLIAGSAYGLNETAENGPQNITSCYMVGTTDTTSGNVVVLRTTSPTYPGKEVTYSTTIGQAIYGIIVDTTNYSGADMVGGKWVRVQTYGRYDGVKCDTSVGGTRTVSAGSVLVCSETAGAATVMSPYYDDSETVSVGVITANSAVLALETVGIVESQVLVDGFMLW